MQQLSEAKQEITTRISPLVAKVIQSDSLFEELDQDQMVEIISDLSEKHSSPAEFRAMPDDELTRRIRRVMAGEVMYNLLSDFTPEQRAEFEAAIPKRK